jgi:AcrR family transcriptional regulator
MASSRSAEASDGRLQRSERSREAIVNAILDLVGAGNLEPTAEQVAEAAGVGIRTVFRHFSDMESLFAAMSARLAAEFGPLLEETPPEVGLAQRARAMVRQRVAFFERIAPHKRAGNLRRWRSAYLRQEHAAMVRNLREHLLRWLPELERAPDDLVEALDLAASFEAWDRLRTEQRLGRTRALAAMQRTVRALTDLIE